MSKSGPFRQKWSVSCNKTSFTRFGPSFTRNGPQIRDIRRIFYKKRTTLLNFRNLFSKMWSVSCKYFTHLFSKSGTYLTKVVRILHKFHPPFLERDSKWSVFCKLWSESCNCGPFLVSVFCTYFSLWSEFFI